MKTTPHQTSYSRYTFRDHTGYIVAPWIPGVNHDWVAIRHSTAVPPWSDRDIHLHSDSEEYYLVLQGELRLLVDGSVFTLRPREALSVGPRVPHAVIGGCGPIEPLAPAPGMSTIAGDGAVQPRRVTHTVWLRRAALGFIVRSLAAGRRDVRA